MDVPLFLERLQYDQRYTGQLSHVEVLPARPPQFGALQRPMPAQLRQLLRRLGIEQLFSHQADAIDLARRGQDLVVVTGTASGKTLCYNLPILETCWEDADARALYLFPTKALAQDQFKGLMQLLSGDDATSARIRAGVYDGDTPPAQRKRIKAEANLVLSNPDMLHASILPYHPKWARFFAGLKYVVLDEVHTYRGILGANVACVLRRLLRVCQHYGAHPVFLAASATIANPGELTSRLIDRDVTVVDNDGSPRGTKYFAMWNPQQDVVPGSDSTTPTNSSPAHGSIPDGLSQRSPNEDAVWLFTSALESGGQCLTFTRTRQAAELVLRYAQDQLRDSRNDLVDAVRAYRGGYLPQERRQIEQDLFSGTLRGVASTNALELGIDVGSLDVTILVQYPGTIASTWQQAGRSGRRNDESLTVLIAGNEPVDQYLLRNPQYFFSQPPEHAVVDAENPYVVANHLRSAAHELPLNETDLATFGNVATTIADCLQDSGDLTQVEGRYYSAAGTNPSVNVSLRHMSDETFSIVLLRDATAPQLPHRLPRAPVQRLPKLPADHRILESPRDGLAQFSEVIANVDAISAPELIYPEAVYLHNGESYFVRELDLEGRVAYVERHEMDYYTQAILESNVRVTDILDRQELMPHAALRYGEAEVRWKTVAFKKIKFSTRENIGYGTVDIPEQLLPTTAMVVIPDDDACQLLKERKMRASEALCGIRNLAIVALPMVAMCDSRDISGVVDSHNFGRPSMILYDRYPGGLGYAEKGYEQTREMLQICFDMVSQCQCHDGCPSCVGLPNLRPAIHSDPDLTRGYPIPDKAAASSLLEMLLASELAVS